MIGPEHGFCVVNCSGRAPFAAIDWIAAMSIPEFLRAEAGVVTIDWTVMLAALTGAGIALTALTTDTLSVHSQNMRGELQDPHFETDWFDNVAVLPPSMQ
ncbi:hypothetical protein N8I71_10955 [Roseibacterium sp. SDUM158016]|jgi:hypothetical protein|uniref:hypothetical protein n=1 Tax=Roseicyclus sediminis TaxID=2980997 RepID=UPI0021D1988D|nr:hypothetical protein [Roseibacterium sp. SDUM158016]MCU4653355.1 hypothetical protein [Roseibacterium sp. SDUM158016]